MSLVVFGFDGTLTRSDTTLGREHDVDGEMAEPAEQASPGDGSFEQTFRQRVSLLEGMPREQVGAGFKSDPVVESHCDAVVTSIRKLRLYFEQHDIIDVD